MSTLSQDELAEIAGGLGEKLGFLIASAPWSDDVKLAWVALLDEMTNDEISEFSEIMEFLFADAMTQEIDDAFEKQTQLVRASHPEYQQKMVALEKLEKTIKQRIG